MILNKLLLNIELLLELLVFTLDWFDFSNVWEETLVEPVDDVGFVESLFLEEFDLLIFVPGCVLEVIQLV